MYIWHLLRHGTRYPSENEVKTLSAAIPDLQRRLRENLAAGRVTLCSEAVERILAWTLNVSVDQGNTLTAQGQQDMLGIAARLQQRYPQFFLRNTDPDSFTVGIHLSRTAFDTGKVN